TRSSAPAPTWRCGRSTSCIPGTNAWPRSAASEGAPAADGASAVLLLGRDVAAERVTVWRGRGRSRLALAFALVARGRVVELRLRQVTRPVRRVGLEPDLQLVLDVLEAHRTLPSERAGERVKGWGRVRSGVPGSGPLRIRPCRAGRGSVVDEADVAGARSLLRFLFDELDARAFPQQLEDGSADGRAVEEMLHAALVANEAETLVNQQPCNRAAGHDCSFAERGTSPVVLKE